MILSISIQCDKDEPIPIVNIPDNNFLNALIDMGIDTDEDGKISQSEVEIVTTLNVSDKSISDLTGIENFVDLEYLECQNNQLTNLDVSNNTTLKFLYCEYNQLSSFVLAP